MKRKRTKYNQTFAQKLHKEFCEVCGCRDKEAIEHHHIIERTEVNTSNDFWNIAIICGNCHSKLHYGNRLKIIGVYPSSAPYGRKLIYELDGQCNVPGITEPYCQPKPLQTKIFLEKK